MKLIMEKCPTDMCHASTLLKTGPDRFLAAWFGGTKEGNGDVAIWFTRGNEEHFEEPKILAQSEEAHWNPVLFRVDEKKIIIFYKVGNEISKWRTMYRVSEDNGETFGEEKELVPGDQGGRGPVRNKPIRLKSGRILAPGSTEQGIWKAFVDRSDDDGKTWIKLKFTDGVSIESDLELDLSPSITEESGEIAVEPLDIEYVNEIEGGETAVELYGSESIKEMTELVDKLIYLSYNTKYRNRLQFASDLEDSV